ncbi:hypothetical protein K3495_g1284 [Podosphaera aphanis]|nr:hypothetical protein K3495_g1284 [Podosphaera aphanis]
MPSIQIQTATKSPQPSMLERKGTLSEQINTATRTTHLQLNKLILTRLPLALPPFVGNPSVYASGLLHIAPIYITFEALWSEIIRTSQDSTKLNGNGFFDTSASEQKLQDTKDSPLALGGILPPHARSLKAGSRIHSLLHFLQLPELLRSRRLLADIQNLTSASDSEIQRQIETVSMTGSLAKFLDYTKSSVERNPHVILAYAWVLYMALFSGGRYIRSSLKDAGGSGVNFWNQDSSTFRSYDNMEAPSSPKICVPTFATSEKSSSPAFSMPQIQGTTSKMASSLQFFHFVGNKDGEDIKAEFKKRVSEAEQQLTESEKTDIVIESQHIFRYMTEVINDLDEIMETQEDDIEITTLMRESKILMTARDSICLARKRIFQDNIARNSRRVQKSDTPHCLPIHRLQKFKTTFEESSSKEQITKIRFLSCQINKETPHQSQSYSILSCVGALICILAWFWFGEKWSQIAHILE